MRSVRARKCASGASFMGMKVSIGKWGALKRGMLSKQ